MIVRTRNVKGPVSRAISAAVMSFYAPLTTTLVPTIAAGSATPTYTRATTAAVDDWEGVVRYALAGEARFRGARRVRNRRSSSESSAGMTVGAGGTGTNAVWTNNFATDPFGGSKACRLVMDRGVSATAADWSITYESTSTLNNVQSVWLKSNTGSNQVVGFTYHNGTLSVTVTPTWKRFSAPVPVSYFGLSNYGNMVGGQQTVDVLVYGMMVEDTTGQSNQNPSEYVSVGVLSAPYHGAGVDGVKYFATQNGNTVASNVVTEATGVAISSSTLQGYLPEPQTTNLLTRSQDFSHTDWNKNVGSVIVTADTTVAPDGTTTADTVTCSAGSSSHQIYQGQTVLAAAYVAEVYAKAGTASWIGLAMVTNAATDGAYFNLTTGAVGTVAAGVTATITPAANGFYRCSVSRTMSAGTGYLSVEIHTANAQNITWNSASGTESVILWQGDLQSGSIPRSPIVTTSASATRNADQLTYALAGNADNTVGTCIAEAAVVFNGSNRCIVGSSSGTGPLLVHPDQALRFYDGTNFNASGSGAITNRTMTKVGCTWGGSRGQMAQAGTLGAATAFDGNMGMTDIGIGFDNATQDYPSGPIRNVYFYLRNMSDAQLQRAVT